MSTTTTTTAPSTPPPKSSSLSLSFRTSSISISPPASHADPRAIAERATNWYLSSLDPSMTHERNVQTTLRQVVKDVTLQMLDEDGTKTRLRRREEARMEAFLASSVDALPPSSQAIARSTTTTTKTSTSTNGHNTAAAASINGHTTGKSTVSTAKPHVNGDEKMMAKRKIFHEATTVSALTLASALSGFNIRSNSSSSLEDDDDEEEAKKKKEASSSPAVAKQQHQQFQLRRRSSSFRKMVVYYTQISREYLVIRLELYIRCLRRSVDSKRCCVVDLEPPKAIRRRAQLVVQSFQATVNCVQSLRPTLRRLISHLTRELLAVDVLGPLLMAAIERIASEYDHQTSFASLAFLSTPQDAAGPKLTPLLLSYMEYLQQYWKHVVSDCELERMLTHSIDTNLRHAFKTAEFQSIAHLLDFCATHQDVLQNIPLPPPTWSCEEEASHHHNHTTDSMAQSNYYYYGDPKVVKQALRDLQREVITVNGHILPPVKSVKELVKLLRQTLNSRPLALKKKAVSATSCNGSSQKKRTPRKAPPLPPCENGKHQSSDSGNLSSSSCDTFGRATTDTSDNNAGTSSSAKEEECLRKHQPRNGVKPQNGGCVLKRKPSFDVSTIDATTRRLLIAASRTGSGGDAYFVVRDLFGGDEVDVVPHHPTQAAASASTSQSSSSSSSSCPMPPGMGTPFSGGTIELVVRLSSITIKCHGRFNVYPKTQQEPLEPLIQLYTTTTECISLQEVRATNTSNGSSSSSVLLLQEKETELTGKRFLSIRPALYERVEVWNSM